MKETIANNIYRHYRVLNDLEQICIAQAISEQKINEYDTKYIFRDDSEMRVYSNPCPIFATTIDN